MAPPAKRRKGNFVVSSSPSLSESECKNENEIFSSTPPKAKVTDSSSGELGAPPKGRSVPQQPKRPAAKVSTAPKDLPKQKTAKKPTTISFKSPEKRPKKAASSESADIETLFTKQAELQKNGRGGKLPKRTLLKIPSLAEDDDDPISDEDDIKPLLSQTSLVAATAKKRKRGLLPSAVESELPPARHKFLKSEPKLDRRNVHIDDDTRPWADRFAPASLEELAVHKRKVADVRAWLEAVMQGHMRQRLLILKGAAGTGKTTTVKLLAKDMKCEVLEWRNADTSMASCDGFLSMSAQFEEFLGRGGMFGQLDIFPSASNASKEPILESVDRRKQIILIEEFPSTFTRSSTALQSFRAAILQYLAAHTPSLVSGDQGSEKITPMVMVISETLLTTASASADSFTAYRLLGPEILQHPGINVIEFNSIAMTILAKALDLVIQKESRKSGRRKIPGPLVLKQLAEVGDVRSAVGSLEFLCLRGDSTDWSGTVAVGKGKNGSKTEPAMTKMEEESLELVTRREASLGIFHAVGKVMYNKRVDIEPGSAAVEQLPEYLSLCSRPRKSQVMVDDLMSETGTDTQTFIAALHENYILSCGASPNSIDYSSIDHVNNCIDALSNSDLLAPHDSFNPAGCGSTTGSGGEILRQDELSFQTAVRGILFSLPYPVKRSTPAASDFRTGKSRDAHRMLYPTSLKLWRMKEEIESIIDTWVTHLKRGHSPFTHSITAGAKAYAKQKPGSVETWVGSPQRYTSSNSQSSSRNGKSREDTSPPPLLAIGTSARTEMLLERLPYTVQTARRKIGGSSSNTNITIREMEKVTTFSGIGGTVEDVDNGDEDVGEDAVVRVEEWATDRVGLEELPAPAKWKWKGNNNFGRKKRSGTGYEREVDLAVQKLFLSDDDIEDD